MSSGVDFHLSQIIIYIYDGYYNILLLYSDSQNAVISLTLTNEREYKNDPIRTKMSTLLTSLLSSFCFNVVVGKRVDK